MINEKDQVSIAQPDDFASADKPMNDYIPDPKRPPDSDVYLNTLKMAVTDLLVFLVTEVPEMMLVVTSRAKRYLASELVDEKLYMQLSEEDENGYMLCYIPPNIDEIIDLVSAGLDILSVDKKITRRILEDITNAKGNLVEEYLETFKHHPGATLQQKVYHNPDIVKDFIRVSLNGIITQINVNRDQIHSYVIPQDISMSEIDEAYEANEALHLNITKASVLATWEIHQGMLEIMRIDMSKPRKICIYPIVDELDEEVNEKEDETPSTTEELDEKAA